MATIATHYDSPHFPPAESDLLSMRKRRTMQTAFGEVPLDLGFWFQKKFIKWWILFALICVLVILMTIFHHQIVRWLEPFAQDMHNLTLGWLIPIGVLFVLSFPPLFGHEIVAILCGLVWGLWAGFGIVSAGTLLGEWGTFYAFRYFLTAKARRMEEKDLNFACMVRLVEKGGFWTVFLARLSAIPGHLTTAVFATTRISFWTFTLAAVLSMPKQLMTVYLGTVFNEEENGTRSTASKIVTDIILVFSFLVTIAAAIYLYRKMADVRPLILAERKLRQQEAAEIDGISPVNSFVSRLSPYSSKQNLEENEETVALAKNAYRPAGHAEEESPPTLRYDPAERRMPYDNRLYANSGYDLSTSSLGDPRGPAVQREGPAIVVQSPSDPALPPRTATAHPAATYPRPPSPFERWDGPAETYASVSHGHAL